jgi:5S rRNA maturation endonuclease (ribonuclease M5)
LNKLKELFQEANYIVDVAIVEGLNDIQALKKIGYNGNILSCQQVGINDFDFIESVVNQYKNILLLTDFDQEGQNLNKHFSMILEQRGGKIENGLRREIGRLTAKLGYYAIEDLGTILDDLE